jgi:adenine phosphoribosyltransferase
MPSTRDAFNFGPYLRSHIRTVPDWPTPGVQFRDITPLLQDPKVFRVLIDAFVHRYMDPALRPDVVAGLDARGFILGAVVAYELNIGFVPIRKKGKLPFTTVQETYELEYGSATVELHTDAVKTGDRVLLIDDLIATGGTMMAGKKLLEKLGARVMEGAAIVDLPSWAAPPNCVPPVCRFSRWWISPATEPGHRYQINSYWRPSNMVRMTN